MLNQICAYWKSIYEFPPILIMTRHCRGKEIQKIARKIHSAPETLILMGFLDKLVSALGLRKKEANVLVVGLDNSGFLTFWNLIITVPKKGDHIITRSLEIFLLSGKSTLLNHFKPEQEQNANIVPTVGFNVEKFKSKILPLLWDIMHQSTFEIKFALASPCLQLFVVMLYQNKMSKLCYDWPCVICVRVANSI